MRDLTPFINRLKKNQKHLAKWAKREHISCYRVYDRDLPEFPLAIDLYGERLHLAEYDTGWQISEQEHTQWIDTVRDTAAQALNVPAHLAIFKTRRRQKGLAQYEKTGVNGQDFEVSEGGLRLIVNLEAYLDTGLFLDHRLTRARIRAEAAGKRMLNLFAYTGSFTVFAAAGGACETTTVDLSNTYQDWTRRNLLLNQFASPVHTLVRADVLNWLEGAYRECLAFDLIVMDPPSFSNSKKMLETLDVQRDHRRLIDGAMALLATGGTLYFSTNLRSFQLDTHLTQRYHIEDISHHSIPEDFRSKQTTFLERGFALCPPEGGTPSGPS